MPKSISESAVHKFCVDQLFWCGALSPKEVRKQFGVGADWTSRFIAALRKRLGLATVGKRYILAPDADTRVLIEEGVSPQRFLHDLSSLAHQLPDDALAQAWGIPVGTYDRLRFRIDVHVLREIVFALRNGEEIEIDYVGMNINEKKIRRTVEPKRLILVGGRWHLSAFCKYRVDHRDFVLSRIRWAGNRAPARLQMANRDRQGKDRAKLEHRRYRPHPHLTPDQMEAVAFEFGMTQDDEGYVLELNERADFIFYIESQFLAHRPDHDLPPHKLLVKD